jgi:capsular polysaccharide biosynthesis protein
LQGGNHMECCSTLNLKQLSEKFNIKVENTTEGVQIKVSPKDKSKVQSLQNMVSACQDFCDCTCC